LIHDVVSPPGCAGFAGAPPDGALVDGFVVFDGAVVVGAAVVEVDGPSVPLEANTTAGTANRPAAPNVAAPVTSRRVLRSMPNPFLCIALRATA
jgi:hypothetical protein